MIHRTTVVFLLAVACCAQAQEARSQTTAGAESFAEKELRLKAQEIDRVADTEFDRSRESAQQRKARTKFENEKRISFSPLTFEDRTILAPPLDEIAQFGSFLAQPETGLVRLLPRERFDGKLAVRGGGAFYSFAHRVHEYRYGSDIGFEQGRIRTASAGAGYAFLFDMGEIPLEGVTTDLGPVKFLAEFSPPVAEPEARKIQRRFHDGYQDGWYVYRQRIPAIAGHTYVIRSVDYGMSDVLVAFRVLRQDENEGLILVWKMLKQFPAPRLERDTAGQKRDR